MKHIRVTTILTIVFIAVILLMPVSHIIMQINAYQNLEAEGLKTLVPVDVKQTKTERHNRGRTTTSIHNYVKFQVQIGETTYGFWMPTSAAYGENSYSVGEKAVKNHKTIERYIFYDGEEIFYSETSADVNAYIKEKVGLELKIIAAVAVFFLLALLFKLLSGLRRLPSSQEGREQIVCRHNSYGFSVLMTICVAVLGLLIPTTGYLVSEGNMAGIMFVGLDILFGIMAVALFLMMLNRVVVICKDEIIFRNILGEVYCLPGNQIEGYTYIAAYKRTEIRIRSKNMMICINPFCINFGEAKRFLEENYTRLN